MPHHGGMPASTAADWYRLPLYYDIVFDADTRLEVAFLEALARRYGLPETLDVLEPACGSGRLVAALAARGHRVAGFDLSAEMLDFARRRLAARTLRADLKPGDMASFAFPKRFDLAHCFVSTFKYLLDEESARSHLACVARALRPGGLYVLGLHLTEYDWDRRQRERWIGERKGTRVVCNIQSWPADRARRLERVRSRLRVTERGATRLIETSWDFRTYDARELRSLLRSVPSLEHVATFDFGYDLADERPLDDEQMDCVLVLRKRAAAARRSARRARAGTAGSRSRGTGGAAARGS